MRIVIMGAGGLGGYIGGRLAEAGCDVTFIARGDHLDAIRAKGLRITSIYGDVHLPRLTTTSEPAAAGPADLILFTVKLWDTAAAAASLAPLIQDKTRVVTLQNGIDSVDMIGRHLPASQVVAGASFIPAVVREPGVIYHSGRPTRVVIDSRDSSPAIAKFVAASSSAIGLDVVPIDPIAPVLWEKLILMSSFVAASSLMRSTARPILTNPESRVFVRQLLEEGVAVSAAAGALLRKDLVDEAIAFYDALPPHHRGSMTEDLERGRRLELRWLSGRIHTLGLEHGVSTPAHSAAWRCLSLYADGTPAAG